jgi:hypothetical protein
MCLVTTSTNARSSIGTLHGEWIGGCSEGTQIGQHNLLNAAHVLIRNRNQRTAEIVQFYRTWLDRHQEYGLRSDRAMFRCYEMHQTFDVGYFLGILTVIQVIDLGMSLDQ